MAEYDDIKKARVELEKLNKEYEQLTGKQLFDIPTKDLKLANSQIEDFSKLVRNAKREASGLSSVFDNLNKQLKANLSEIDKANSSLNMGKRAYREIVNTVRQLADEEAGIDRISFSQLKKLKSRSKSALEETKLAGARLAAEKGISKNTDLSLRNLNEYEEALLRAYQGSFKAEERANQFVGFRLDLERRVLDTVKLTGGALTGIGNLASSIGLTGFAESLDEIKGGLDDELRKSIREAAVKKFDIANAGAYEKAQEEIKESSAAIVKLQESISTGLRPTAAQKKFLTQQKVKLKNAKEFLETSEEGVQALYDQVDATNTLGAKFRALKKTGKEFIKQLSDPLFLISSMVKGFMAMDEASTSLQRLTGQNSKAFAGLNDELVTNVENLELMAAFAKETGRDLSTLFSSQEVGVIRSIGDNLGYSAEESSKLALNTALSGINAKEFTDEAFRGAQEVAVASGTTLNLGQAMGEASKLSGALALNLSNNPAELGRATAEAQRLGLNLQQLEGIASGMLDFESSIQSELEAQLLTGKRINLAKAREAALRGDMATLASEIGKQEGVMQAFATKNVVAQEAAAKAVGMTRNELAKVISLRAIEDGYSEEEADRMADMVPGMSKQLSVQQKINKAMGKLQQAAAPLLDMLVPLVDVFTTMIRPIAASIAGVAKFGTMTRTEIDKLTDKVNESPFLALMSKGGSTLIKLGIAGKSYQMLMSLFGMSKGTVMNPMITMDVTKGGLKTMFQKLVKYLPFGIGSALKNGMGTLSNGFRAVAQGAFRNGFRLMFRGIKNLAGKVLLPLTAIVQTVKDIGDFFMSSKLRETGAAGMTEALGGSGAKIIEDVSFGGTKWLTNFSGITMKDFDTDDLAGARAIYRNNNPEAPTTIPNTTLLKDIKTNPQLYPEGFDDQATAASKHIEADDFTIRTNPKDSLIMAGGTKFGEETNALLKQLISEVSNIKGDVYIDGYKAGQSIFAASNNLPS